MIPPEEDTRNVVNEYKGLPLEDIVADLDTKRISLEIAVENISRDFNMGTIIRTANAFNVAKVHVIGSKQWNKRGAMKTDAYLHIKYHRTVEDFYEAMHASKKEVVAVDIVDGAMPLHEATFTQNTVLVFGAEGPGLSNELLAGAHKVVYIEQFGSTRSINVGVAAGVVMYEWMRRHVLRKGI